MRCPACSNMMIVVEHEHIELDYCPDCAGVWFDTGELELLLEPLPIKDQVLSLDSILTSTETKSKEKKRKCPICRKKMKKTTVGHEPEVLIDACRYGDGLWFDRGEVDQLLSQLSDKLSGESDSQQSMINFMGKVFTVRD